MSNTSKIPLVQPKIIPSPITGVPISPRVSDRRVGQNIYTEAVWVCPSTGEIVKKGVVAVKPVE